MKWMRVLVAVLIIVAAGAGLYTLLDVSVEGTYELEPQQIIEKGGNYYIKIDNRELALSREFYSQLDFSGHTEYNIKYVYNRYGQGDGEVVSIKKYGEQPWGK